MGAAIGFLDDGESLDFSFIEPAQKYAEPGRASPALHGVASEIATLAGPIATVASLYNAAEISTSSDHPHVLAVLPPEPVVYPAVISSLAGLHPDLIGEIQHFHVRLAFARKATTASLTRSPAVSDFGIQNDVLADIWRELCQAAVDIIDKARDRGVEFDQQSTRLPRLRNTLTRAAAGETPCIMADGSIEIPGIAERRLQPRYSVSWQAWLQADGDWQQITLFDISSGGIGAEADGEAAAGNAITGQMTAGQTVNLVIGDQQLTGRIAWTREPRFAVQFDAPLRHDSALLVAARNQPAID